MKFLSILRCLFEWLLGQVGASLKDIHWMPGNKQLCYPDAGATSLCSTSIGKDEGTMLCSVCTTFSIAQCPFTISGTFQRIILLPFPGCHRLEIMTVTQRTKKKTSSSSSPTTSRCTVCLDPWKTRDNDERQPCLGALAKQN